MALLAVVPTTLALPTTTEIPPLSILVEATEMIIKDKTSEGVVLSSLAKHTPSGDTAYPDFYKLLWTSDQGVFIPASLLRTAGWGNIFI